jgi:nucleotide-binding universal stress UspA family protein
MLKLERILCPVDFSECSEKAYDYAYSLALHYQATLYVEHVIPILDAAYPYYSFPQTAGTDIYCDVSKSAERKLNDMVSRHSVNDIWVERAVHKGYVPDSILAFAQNQQADLIVMGTHGRRGLNRLMMGSTTENVLRRASCPVLAVRKPTHDFVNPERKSDPVGLQKILACIDFSNSADVAAEYALSLAQEYNAELTLLHVIERPPTEDLEPRVRYMREALEERIPQAARNWCKVKTVVRVGKAYQEIAQLAAEEEIDLAVLGVRGRGAVDLAIFGSTTYRLLQLGSCPVLAVHMPAGRERSERPEFQGVMKALTAA